MTLGERIKKVRKDKDLTQQEFASRIGSTQNALTGYETGRRNPSRSVINNICKTFNINDEWLRNGIGEIYGPKPTAALELLALDHHLTNGDYILIEKFLNLKPEIRRALVDYAREVAAAIADEEADGVSPDTPVALSSDFPGIPITDEEIKKRAAMYEELAQDNAYDELQRAGVDPEIEADVAEYRRQLLAEKERNAKSSVSPSDTWSGTGKMA